MTIMPIREIIGYQSTHHSMHKEGMTSPLRRKEVVLRCQQWTSREMKGVVIRAVDVNAPANSSESRPERTLEAR